MLDVSMENVKCKMGNGKWEMVIGNWRLEV